jgi:hypothetical protein
MDPEKDVQSVINPSSTMEYNTLSCIQQKITPC